MRKIVLGSVAGFAAFPLLLVAASAGRPVWEVLLVSVLAGIALAFVFNASNRSIANTIMSGGAIGVPLWALIHVVAVPLLQGMGTPLWSADGMRGLFPLLVGWVLWGAAMGVLLRLATGVATRILGPEPIRAPANREIKTRILILGGGFAGMSTASHLEEEFGADTSVEITLVSENNALLFTPMLAEVAASSLEPTHISTPLRTSLRRTNVIRATATSIDLDAKSVGVSDARNQWSLPFDHLVLALGSVSNYLGMKNVEQRAYDFKSISDAMHIRNRVIDMFERANRESDPAQRKAMLTFVIAGAGFAGAELAGGLNDFTRGMLADYPQLSTDDLKIVVLHPRDRILPELSEPLAKYAEQRMTARGVTFMLNTRLNDCDDDSVTCTCNSQPMTIPGNTLVWTAGTTPNPLLRTLPPTVERDKRGAVLVANTLAVAGHPGVWSLGDCAVVPDTLNPGKTCPPTAQFALREAKTVAHNIKAVVSGKSMQSFRFKALGLLAVVGHHTACAELSIPFTNKTILFSGLMAWLMWRAIYLGKLPGLERKVRVMSDWLIELFFPRDIVQTTE